MTDTGQNGIFVRTVLDLRRELHADKRNGSQTIHTVRVSNQTMLIAVKSKTLICQSLSCSSKPKEIIVPLTGSDTMEYLHLSPTGFHALISSRAGDNFYYNIKEHIIIPIKKLKDQISAVGWNPENFKETETGPILLGSTTGVVYETNISSNGYVNYIKDFPNVFNRNNASKQKICELQLFVVSDSEPGKAKWVLLVCQSDMLYSLRASIGPPLRSTYLSSASLQNIQSFTLSDQTQHVFQPFFEKKNIREEALLMPESSNAPISTDLLVLYRKREDSSKPFKFLWVGSSGYMVGKVNLFAEKSRDILEKEKHFEHGRVEGLILHPVGASLTEFHLVLAYPHRMLAISLQSYEVAFEDALPSEHGQCIGLTFDQLAEYHWLYTATATLKYRPNDEGRYAWRYFLNKGDYANAISVSNERLHIDPDAHRLVLRKQADKYIADKNFVAAALALNQSNEPFETVVSKLLSADDGKQLGLQTFLEQRLMLLSTPEDKMKRDVLVMWILDVQLSQMAKLRRESGSADEIRESYDHLERFLNKKLIHESVNFNREAAYRLMIAHADFDAQLYLSKQLKDYPTVISILLMREQYKEVLDILIKENSPEAFYDYSSQLVEHIPFDLFRHLIENERIQPSRMLPTLCECQKLPKVAKQAIRYLEWAVTLPKYCRDYPLNNLLILLYAQYSPTKLHDYFVENGKEKSCLPYDLEFAIRTCEQYGHDKSLVFLYCVSELFMEAVEKALQISLDLAKTCASHMEPESEYEYEAMGLEPRYSKDDRKRIWLKIAKYVIEREKDVAKCIDLLKESRNALSIQDIFPYFPDFTKIEHFKDALCDCLKDHSKNISEIQLSLKEATQVAQDIRERTDRLKNRVTIVKVGDVCAVCKHSLAGRPFYPFECRHFYHRECLESSAAVFLSPKDRERLDRLVLEEKRALYNIEVAERSGGKGDAVTKCETRFQEIMKSLDELLGNDCPLCGMNAIELIDTPLFTDAEYLVDLESWRISKNAL
ncbi:unnamed protein product [Auanema sp. JU1783]|nr:unnamed protein product [Auanema sp. JU1783]